MKSLEWYSVAEGLKSFLRNFKYEDGRKPFQYLPNYENLHILVGTGNTGEYPLVEILLGEETKLEKPSNRLCSNIQLWIDIYVGGQNEVGSTEDFGQALYKQIYSVEKELVFLIHKYSKSLYTMYNSVADVDIVAVLSDGDENAPVTIQHRVVVNFEIYTDKIKQK